MVAITRRIRSTLGTFPAAAVTLIVRLSSRCTSKATSTADRPGFAAEFCLATLRATFAQFSASDFLIRAMYLERSPPRSALKFRVFFLCLLASGPQVDRTTPIAHVPCERQERAITAFSFTMKSIQTKTDYFAAPQSAERASPLASKCSQTARQPHTISARPSLSSNSVFSSSPPSNVSPRNSPSRRIMRSSGSGHPRCISQSTQYPHGSIDILRRGNCGEISHSNYADEPRKLIITKLEPIVAHVPGPPARLQIVPKRS